MGAFTVTSVTVALLCAVAVFAGPVLYAVHVAVFVVVVLMTAGIDRPGRDIQAGCGAPDRDAAQQVRNLNGHPEPRARSAVHDPTPDAAQ
jgi:hypothetical protein